MTPSDADGDAALAGYASALGDAVEAVLAAWVVRSVTTVWSAYRATLHVAGDDEAVRRRAEAAGQAAVDDVVPRLRSLLALDIDEQRTNPLDLLRGAVAHPTEVLRDLGVPPVVRDEFDERAFPADDYALTPASFADIDPTLHEPGLVWGAAKAHVHLRRRSEAGSR